MTTESDGTSYAIRAVEQKICLPYPIPQTLKCGYCNRGRGGKWTAFNRVDKAKEHLVSKHPSEAEDNLWTFRCSRCNIEHDSLDNAALHQANCSITETSQAAPPDPLVECFLSGDQLVLLFPGRPSRCPIPNCNDGFITAAKDTAAMNSIHRHMVLSHNFDKNLKKIWRCSICSTEQHGLLMRHHFNRCKKGSAQNSAAIDHADPNPSMIETPPSILAVPPAEESTIGYPVFHCTASAMVFSPGTDRQVSASDLGHQLIERVQGPSTKVPATPPSSTVAPNPTRLAVHEPEEAAETRPS